MLINLLGLKGLIPFTPKDCHLAPLETYFKILRVPYGSLLATNF